MNEWHSSSVLNNDVFHHFPKKYATYENKDSNKKKVFNAIKVWSDVQTVNLCKQ